MRELFMQDGSNMKRSSIDVITGEITESQLSQEEIDNWQDTDFDWTNEEYERTNSISVEFKKDSFESNFFLSSKDINFTAIGQFKNNKIDVKIER